MERWQHPTAEQKQELGALIWRDLLKGPVRALVTQEGLDSVLPLLLTEQAARAVWAHLPKEAILSEAEGIHASDVKVRDLLGPDAVAHLKKMGGKGGRPNRKLIEQMMDQPYIRQALRNLVQRSIQQFLQQFRPGAVGRKVPGGRVLGTIGRGIAHRAERAAKAGKSLVEGVGGTLYRQLEEQLQPFLAGFMNRSVQILGEVLFEGEEQARLARDARLHVLEVLLDAPVSSLFPPPSAEQLDDQVQLAAHVAAHLMGVEQHRERVERLVRAVYGLWADRTVQELLEAFDLPVAPPGPVLEAIGEVAYTVLTGPSAQTFLEQELEAIW